MKTELQQINAGKTLYLRVNIKITTDKTLFFTEDTLNEVLTDMAKYYFTGDISILEKYIKAQVDIKETIENENAKNNVINSDNNSNNIINNINNLNLKID